MTAGDVKNAFLELARQAEDGIANIARGWWKAQFRLERNQNAPCS